MSCNSYTIGGRSESCNSTGGIRSVSIAQYPSSGVTFSLNTAGTEITGITGIAAGDWKTYNFKKQSSGLEKNATIDDPNGVSFVTTNLNLRFTKMETALRSEIMGLLNLETIVKVTDNNGIIWVLGEWRPVTATASAGGTGVNLSDPNQYTITLTDLGNEYPKQYTGS